MPEPERTHAFCSARRGIDNIVLAFKDSLEHHRKIGIIIHDKNLCIFHN